ncbi:unnamed protein product [Sphenostylis stenocarpa]|uniref:Uncharacterized protein n=1 Tax=Sphenostylis stenocarpa TaxID=92480 RepID=A0AA86S3B9_9FABA|nr:unnamed protein product [Sphenostylis stenocarpa]
MITGTAGASCAVELVITRWVQRPESGKTMVAGSNTPFYEPVHECEKSCVMQRIERMKGSKKGKREKEKKTKIEDEVEEMLQAVQDEVLLTLSQAHMTRASSSVEDLDPDLERRFQALKMKTKPNPQQQDQDLSARFGALKAKSSRSISNSNSYKEEEESEDDEETQVQKLIQWAKDAARLNPSPPSDDDD